MNGLSVRFRSVGLQTPLSLRPGFLTGLALGACWPLSFAPFDQSYLAILLLAVLFGVTDQALPGL